MPRILKRASVLGVVAVGLTVGGCVIITGGTGGYSQAEGGADGDLFGDAGSSCAAASDCNSCHIC